MIVKRAGATVLLGLVMATYACAPDAPPTLPADDPWPGRFHRYTSTDIMEGGRDRELAGAAFLEVSFHEVGVVSAYAGCNVLTMSVRLNGGRMLVDSASLSTDRTCEPDEYTDDLWMRAFFESDPRMRNEFEIVLTSGDVEITLLRDVSPS